MDTSEQVDRQEIEKTIDKLGLGIDIDEMICQNGIQWLKDFLAGISCGIAAQKIVR